MKFRGKVWKFGNNINTDEIIPARYLNISATAELARHVMEGVDKNFPKRVKPGGIIVAGKNFGCGSSREHAPWAIKGAGLSCVVAETFARIFFRNAINIGLPVFESSAASKKIRRGDIIEVDAAAGVIKNITRGEEYSFQAFPEAMQRLVAAGGLMKYVGQKMKAKEKRKK